MLRREGSTTGSVLMVDHTINVRCDHVAYQDIDNESYFCITPKPGR